MLRNSVVEKRPPDSVDGDMQRPLGLHELQNVFALIRSDLVRHLTRRTGSAEWAADISHDVFEKLASIRAEIPSVQKARSYIYRMAGNLAIDHGRIEARRSEILTGSQILFEDVEYSPETIAISRQELRTVEEALDELPAKCKQVLLLARMQGLSHKEIASHLGVSVSLVEKYQRRALRHCRDRLEMVE